MAKGNAQLRLVADNNGAGQREADRELVALELRALFGTEATRLRDLADVRADIDAARRRYSALHDLRVFASTDSLRRQFGPDR